MNQLGITHTAMRLKILGGGGIVTEGEGEKNARGGWEMGERWVRDE
jgi:hypothetical protein